MTAASIPGFFSAQIAEASRFHLDLNPPADVPLAVVSGGRENCAADYEIHRLGFPFWGLEFVARGSGSFRIGEEVFEILPGSVFSYGPDTGHDILTNGTDLLVKYFVDFTGSRAAGLLASHGLNPGRVIQTSVPGEVAAIFDDLIRNGLKCTPLSGRITAAILQHLLLKLEETAMPNGASGSPAFATYHRCREHIQSHWAALDSLAQIASDCHLDATYLCRLFRRFDRQSPYQLLLRLKINHAAERLRGEQVAVAQVAEELRFADPFHFSRVFKKFIGISPSHFIRRSGR
jgi:AraC-like DNA-binding protein